MDSFAGDPKKHPQDFASALQGVTLFNSPLELKPRSRPSACHLDILPLSLAIFSGHQTRDKGCHWTEHIPSVLFSSQALSPISPDSKRAPLYLPSDSTVMGTRSRASCNSSLGQLPKTASGPSRIFGAVSLRRPVACPFGGADQRGTLPSDPNAGSDSRAAPKMLSPG